MQTNQRLSRRVSDPTPSIGSADQNGIIRVDIEGYERRASLPIKEPRSSSSKRVCFSEYSFLHLYEVDPEENKLQKSNSHEQQRALKRQTAIEALRIKQLINMYQLQSGNTVRRLIDLRLITREELLGIEHLISEKAALRMQNERQVHTDLLLMQQQKLRDMNSMDVEKLAEVTRATSVKSANRARLRAALAA